MVFDEDDPVRHEGTDAAYKDLWEFFSSSMSDDLSEVEP
jgi:hypothetical protein